MTVYEYVLCIPLPLYSQHQPNFNNTLGILMLVKF